MSPFGRAVRRGAVSIVVCAAVIMSGAPASADATVEVLLSGLSSPKGLALAEDGNPVVAQGAFGAPGPVLLYLLRGPDAGSTIELTDPLTLIDVAVTPDGVGWAIQVGGLLLRQAPGGPVETVLDIVAYQLTDPDPYDQDDFPEESNAYGLAVLPSGDALVADAANNDLFRVTPAGDVTTVARFATELVSTDHLPPELGLPPEITAEAVPTSIAIGPGGDVLVGELKGYPFRPGSSRIWRVDPDASEALCAIGSGDPSCRPANSGFTAVVDIAYDAERRNLFVYELAAESVPAFEEGFVTGVFPPAVLLVVGRSGRTELAPGQLSQPGGVVVHPTGAVIVTDGIFGDGRLVLLRA